MGKFFNGKVKNSKENVLRFSIIGGGLLIFLIIIILVIKNNATDINSIIEVKQVLEIEVNSALPDKKEYFAKFDNYNINKVKINTDNVDIKKVGTYIAVVTLEGKNYEVSVSVVDKTAPKLTVKDLKIAPNTDYSAAEFVDSCKDNYSKECIISFYLDDQDQNGNLINYSEYKEQGKYIVRIVAADENGNTTEPINANLIIGDETNIVNPEPINCDFGNLEIPEKIDYPLSLIVGDEINNCAQDRNLFDSENNRNKIDNLWNSEFEKLKTDIRPYLDSKYPYGAKLFPYVEQIAIWNKENKGLVGYALYVKLYINTEEQPNDENLVLSYYLRKDGTREYKINNINLK